MKKTTLILAILLITISYGQTPCSGGSAAGYPCEGYDLLSQISASTMSASIANDSWGWVDPQNGKEYALVALDNGTAFIDISDPINPVYLGKLPTHTTSTTWRDVKVYNNHAFVVSEAGGHGMQVFDLTRLRNVTNPPETFTEDAHYDGFGSAHNIVITEDSDFAYGLGTSTFGGGPHFIDISDPLNPIAAGGYSQDGYSHDAQIVTYIGPDADYTGKEIYLGSHGERFGINEVSIVDITDKSNPIPISTIMYSNASYAHQGWFTLDQRYFILGDELDESDFGFNTKTIVFDLQDLDNPQHLFDYFGATEATDHNGYVIDDKYYMANYNRGLTVLDISDIANQNITEQGYFDVYPSTNAVGTAGTWNVYPFFESGNIVITGDFGFTLVKSNEPVASFDENSLNYFAIYPNPTQGDFTISSSKNLITTVSIINLLGQTIYNEKLTGTINKTINTSSFASGVYLVKINNTTVKQLIVK